MDLQGANLQAATLHGTNLRGANLQGANLSEADLDGADLSSAHLGDTEANRVILYQAKLGYATLRELDLRGFNLTELDLRNADLNGSDLRGAILRGANLQGADLSNAHLNGPELHGAILHRGAFLGGRGEQIGREEATQQGFSQSLEGALKMTKIKIGLVGLGEVTQIIHVPILQANEDKFEIAAICDISPELLSALGERYHVPVEHRYLDAESLAKQGDLDAIFVLNSDEYHTDAALAALGHRKHVFIEKPMCLTRQDAEAIIKARDEAGVQVMVGYMRRYAPAFVQAVEHVHALEKINYARVRDIIGQNSQFIEQSGIVLRPKDIPAEAMQNRAQRASQLVKTAIGDASQNLVGTYRMLCSLSSHDLSAMRELLGMPKQVIAARQWGFFLTVLFAYEGFTATFETGIDRNRRFDAHIQVYGETKEIRVQYNTPYIRHLPTLLFLNETHGEAFEERVIRPTFTDAYTVELLHFYEVVTQNAQPKTSAEDFLHDLDLFEMIIKALRE